jgi:D-alanyl-D-alanine dipeptidase
MLVNKHRSRLTFFLSCLFLFAIFPNLRAQTSVTAGTSLLPGPKPLDVPLNWKQLVGIYESEKGNVVILERNKTLLWRTSDDSTSSTEIPISTNKQGSIVLTRSGLDDIVISVRRNQSGDIVGIELGEKFLRRIDAGSDPTHFYHITLSKSLSQLRTAALAANPPTEKGHFRKSDLVELATLDSAIHLDIRYAQSNNFLSTPVYTQARAFMQRHAAEALLRVLHKLQPLGYGLLIHDAYRPWYVTKIFWDATPSEDHIFVADPQKGSRHNRGCAVDLTLYDLATGQLIEMPGLYDEMSPRSFPTFPGGTSLQRWHRDLLGRGMESEGFTVNENEWWHFDYKDWELYPILNVPFEEIQTVPRAMAF